MEEEKRHGNSKYKPEYAVIAGRLCEKLAATDRQLADYFDVSYATFQNWKNDYPELLDSLKQNKEIADENVVKSLYQRAMGYDVVTPRVIADGVVVEDVKHYPADPTSMIFWLKNRQPKNWRDKPEMSPEFEAMLGMMIERRVIDTAKPTDPA